MSEISFMKCDLDEQHPHTHPTHTVPGKHGFGLATITSMHCTDSSETSEDNVSAPCPAIRPGYIII